MTVFAGFARPLAVLRQPTFGRYILGNLATLIGTWMQRMTIGWLTWDMTGSTVWLGIMAFADLFPAVVVTPWAGALADRLDRRRIVMACQALTGCLALLLAGLVFTHTLSVGLLTLVTVLLGTAFGLAQPARLALLPALVDGESLATAVAINSIVFNTARFIGPAVAGAFLGLHLPALVFLGVAAGAALYVAVLYHLPLAREPSTSENASTEERARLRAEVLNGLRYIARHHGLGPLLLLVAVNNIMGRPFVELLPGFADRVFGEGAAGLALMMSTLGLGAIAGGVWLALRQGTTGLARATVMSSWGLAAALALFLASPSLNFALPVLAVSGCAMVIAGAGAHTLVQLTVDPAMRGRVLGLFGLLFRGGPAIGALAMGWAAEGFGLKAPVALGATGVAAAAILLWLRRERWMPGIATTTPPPSPR